MNITFRAVSLTVVSGQADANKGILYSVLDEIRNSPLFDPDPEETKPSGNVGLDEPNGTFTFGVVARLKHPLKPY